MGRKSKDHEATKILGSIIKNIRISAAKTQKYVSRCLDVTETEVRRWEKGSAIPDGDHMLEMIRMLPRGKTLTDFGIEKYYAAKDRRKS